MNAAAAPAPLPQAKECCPTSTRKRIEFKHALLVDVREKDELEKLALDVPDLLNIPLSDFERRFKEIPRDRQVIMVSADGHDSLRATYYLMREGYEDVLNMTDGIAKWILRGFPVKGDCSGFKLDVNAGGCCSAS
ncbi:MAG: rhodanese-like domain-containing protein [Proteobacteria bacterium]|nr:rhodanese-like domain-containing protein [Pseudomonadota bacterium]